MKPPRAWPLAALRSRVAVPAALAGLVLAQTWLFRRNTSETFDEFTYLRMGISVFKYGKFTDLASPMTPPLPILLEYWWPGLASPVLPDTPDWEMTVPGLIRQARLLTSITLGIPLAWAVYGWLRARRGWVIGAIGGGLVACSPSVLANASISTTDACFALFGVLALAGLHRYESGPTRGRYLVAGVGLGLALAAKQTAAILFPMAGLVLLATARGRRPGETRVDWVLGSSLRIGVKLSGLIAIAFVIDWGLYAFQLGPPFGAAGCHTPMPVVVPMVLNLVPDGERLLAIARLGRPPLAIDTFLGQLDHASYGHLAFFMGQHSTRGWTWFFPVALAIKSTPAELTLFAIAGVMSFSPGTWRDRARRLWLLTLWALIGSGMSSSINIGQRYMLLAYPLVILIGLDALGTLRPGRALALAGVLLAWQVGSAVGVAPHYLSYFNSFCGGPEQGYRYLVDSSLDWGQDLPSLRRALEARGYRKVALCYFGTASPRSYGIRSMDSMSHEDPVASGCDWLAVSCTGLQGAYTGSSTWLDHFGRLPSTRVAHSIFLYDLSDPGVRAALVEMRRISQGRESSEEPRR